MFSNLSLPAWCTRLAEAVDRLDGPGTSKAYRAVADRVGAAGPDELTAGLRELVPTLGRVAVGNGGPLIAVVAGLIETGADPFVALDVLVDRVTRGLRDAARFPEVMGDEKPDPPNDAREANELIHRITTEAAEHGVGADEAGRIMQAWFTVNDWIPGLLLPLQQKRVRVALPGRAALLSATEAMVDHADDARWLHGLLLVLDDEELIVVHRASGTCHAVTISGVGDNFQLHTLLAATLIGDPAAGLIPGERPHPSWVAAATTSPEMAPAESIRGQFNLVAADGEWIWNEGRPADIPAVDGRRVIVLDPPSYQRSWNYGRSYPLMPPEIRLTRTLSPADAAPWLAHLG